MLNVMGKWDCVVKLLFGEQKLVLIVIDNGDGIWFGDNSGVMGSLVCDNGKFDGDNKIIWMMDMKVLMLMMFECDVMVDGDMLIGGVKVGMFGILLMLGMWVG